MLKTVFLGGKQRPVLLGNAAFKMLQEATGLTAQGLLEEIAGGNVSHLPDAIYCALRCGEMGAGQTTPEDYNVLQAGIWFDLSDLTNETFVNMIAESFTKVKPEDAKKKGASPAPTQNLTPMAAAE